MDFQQIRDFVNPAVAQATGLQEVDNLQMPVPVAYVPAQLVIDGALSLTSENPVQNKVIAVAIQQLDGRITAIEGQFSEGVTEAVNNWLAAHPEATTTVQDGAITYAKLDANLKGKVDQIESVNSKLDYAIYQDIDYNGSFSMGYITTNQSVGAVVDIETVTSNNSYIHWIISVKSGDKFTITSAGGSGARSWALLDNDKKMLANAPANARLTNYNLLVDKDGYLVVNAERAHVIGVNVQGHQLIETATKETQDAVANSTLQTLFRGLFVVHKTHNANGVFIDSEYRNAIVYPISFPFDVTIYCDSLHLLSYQTFANQLNTSFVATYSSWIPLVKITAGTWFTVVVRNNDDSATAESTTNGISIVCGLEWLKDELANSRNGIYNNYETVGRHIRNLFADQYFGAERFQIINGFSLKKLTPETYGKCDLKICYFTDVHTDSDRLDSCVKSINFLGTDYVDAVLNGGDTTAVTDTESLAWYYSSIDKIDADIPVLNTVGNHDAWASQNVVDPDPVNVYDLIIAPMVQRTTVVQPANAAQNGLNYYYKDFGAVRLVTLDCMYWTEAQNTWLSSVLSDAKENDLHVIISTHASFPWDKMESVPCLWSTAGYPNYSAGMASDPTRTNIQAAQTVQNFIDDGGNFVCWVTGHQHGDDVHKLPNYGNQFIVTLGSLAQRASTLLKNTDRFAYNYSCLTYICVDTTSKIVKFLRIGADIDVYGVRHNGLSINYGNNSLVASW